jgi:hypothetical protein
MNDRGTAASRHLAMVLHVPIHVALIRSTLCEVPIEYEYRNVG